MKNFEGRNNPRNDHSEEKCYRTHRNEPYFYLSPLKLEVMMEKPVQLHLYHSVLTSKDINQIKEYTELMVRNISIKVFIIIVFILIHDTTIAMKIFCYAICILSG